MITAELCLDPQQAAALEVDLSNNSLAVCGPSGAGKTTILGFHLRRTLAAQPGACLALTAATTDALREHLAGFLTEADWTRVTCSSVEDFVRAQQPLLPNLRIVNATQARALFLRCAEPLLSATWPSLVSGEIDPEVSGLRTPERFLDASFRLMQKLLASGLDPLGIEESALRASMQFYAKPPNFADPELLRGVKEEHRGSLRVDRAGLEQQRRREIDLTRIIVQLFGDFTRLCTAEKCITEAGFTQQLSAFFQQQPHQAAALHAQFHAVILDDAQELTVAQLGLLQSIWGETLNGMMLAGDIHASMSSFQGARAQRTIACASEQIILHRRRRGTQQTIAAQQAIFAHPDAPTAPPDAPHEPTSLRLQRCSDAQAQAEHIAAFIGEQLNLGVAPGDCAVVLRTLRCSSLIVDALLAHDIPVDCAGDINFTSDPSTLDAVALLWCLAAPKQRPDAVLRLLSSPLLQLSDRSIALLCVPPQDPSLFPQATTSAGRPQAQAQRISQFLANVFDGSNDHILEVSTQTRLAGFREQLCGWRELLATSTTPGEALSAIVATSGLAGGKSVRARYSRNLLSRVLGGLLELGRSEPGLELEALLTQWEAQNASEHEERVFAQLDHEAVCVSSVHALRGRAFDVVAIGDARAGAFPRYFVPEAMLYSPQRGFIARENAGSTLSARSAKFTWYLEKHRIREAYNAEERRIFSYTLGRARQAAFVSAWGPATRGKTAPEFLEELRQAHTIRT